MEKKLKAKIRIGTSGWSYAHWRGVFYPDSIKQGDWFGYYSNHFDTVEVNNSFYQLPQQTTFEKWYTSSPDDFLFTVKANRYITHLKRLKEAENPLKTFLDRVCILKEKLGPILFQLPPSMKFDEERLRSFLFLLPKDIVSVFEFRNESWLNDKTFNLLNEHNAALCVHDIINVPKLICGGVIYLRLHGATGKYEGKYSNDQLKNWARWINDNKAKIKTAYVYFNNDQNGYAVKNAEVIKKMCVC